MKLRLKPQLRLDEGAVGLAVGDRRRRPSRWPGWRSLRCRAGGHPGGICLARQPVPVGRRGSSCGRCLSAVRSGAGSCPPPTASLRSFFDVVSRRSIQLPLVYEGLKVTSCLLMPWGGESGVGQPVVTPRSGWRSLRWPPTTPVAGPPEGRNRFWPARTAAAAVAAPMPIRRHDPAVENSVSNCVGKLPPIRFAGASATDPTRHSSKPIRGPKAVAQPRREVSPQLRSKARTPPKISPSLGRECACLVGDANQPRCRHVLARHAQAIQRTSA